MSGSFRAEEAKIARRIRAHDHLIQTLRLGLAKLKIQALGNSLEKIERECEQLELTFERLLLAYCSLMPKCR